MTCEENKAGTDLDAAKLYPSFWRLQQAFSNPTRLFSLDALEQFKTGLTATVAAFKRVPIVPSARSNSTSRKRKHGADDVTTEYSPKYLTSKDLFQLEVDPR